jgi:hypothetical protein
MVRTVILAFLMTLSVVAVAGTPAGRGAPESKTVQEVRAAMDRAKQEASNAKDAWDKSKLEATLWDQRYKRAYQEWTKSKGDARSATLKKRDQSEVDLKVALEGRRVNWYRYELARRRVLVAEENLKIAELEAELEMVLERLKGMQSVGTPASTEEPSLPEAPAGR